jgi:membrane associated rhomboid family serine protease
MIDESLIVIVIILANAVMSYKGFEDFLFREKFLFNVGEILHRKKEYIRLLSSGFLHADWMHLIFNMLTFYFFGPLIETVFGIYGLLVIYFGSLLGGNILALFIHRHHYDYRALGASGAVSGIVFAAILVDPRMHLYLMFIPIGIPAWIFGTAYVFYSIYGIRSQAGNIGHEAHLGGAIVGLLLGIALNPLLALAQPILVGAMLVPSLFFMLILIRDPNFMITGRINWRRVFGRD